MAEGQDDPKKITITVKTPKEKQQVDIEEDADIRKLKEALGPRFGAEPEQLCLIFAGKIMNDADTLKQHNIKDGLTVHLVIKTPPRPEPEGGPRRPPADIGATPFGLNSLGGLAGLESLGLGQSTFMDLQARMQQELLSNPDMLRQVLDNPLVQQMMNDPENMRTLITSNPQMQDLMARNPEISHMLNNPELLRQTMELARNPAMLQELMRSHDRALSNLESIPGGYNALQRMYRDIQEPMLNAASSMAGNPFSGLVDNSDGTNPQQGAENRQPLPNPWQRGGGGGGGGGGAGGAGGAGSGPGLINTPGMQSLLQQMSENPRLVQSMLSAPYTNSMLQALAADPDMASRLINQNPMFANNPQLQEQMRTMMPQMLAQLQNPEMQQMMSNPQALNALLQIQQGMEQLRTAAPSLVNNLGLGVGAATAAPAAPPPPSTPAPQARQQQNEELFSQVLTALLQPRQQPGARRGRRHRRARRAAAAVHTRAASAPAAERGALLAGTDGLVTASSTTWGSAWAPPPPRPPRRRRRPHPRRKRASSRTRSSSRRY
ncbi:LOW QUALITY PROTEIN: ubiquilin-1-like [Cydia pomonella]|uniref:LOW QUALITY PROTEIN: ubiquilin-1-like n=1 Tax=Cydia pomonella TaxID=82600 RepID=UPI002ADE2384|nr:LOW QUALITY PROTEIN: ubiquilin-1-like [Cydia pomonella]